jgi:hypothetical protein
VSKRKKERSGALKKLRDVCIECVEKKKERKNKKQKLKSMMNIFLDKNIPFSPPFFPFTKIKCKIENLGKK